MKKTFLKCYLWPNVKKAIKFAIVIFVAIVLLVLEAWACFWLGLIGIPIFLVLIFIDVAIAFAWDEYLIDTGKKRPY